MRKKVIIIVYPFTTRLKGVLYINKGRTQGMLLLRDIKRIKDYIKLLIRL
jgi:hypothetical protein